MIRSFKIACILDVLCLLNDVDLMHISKQAEQNNSNLKQIK